MEQRMVGQGPGEVWGSQVWSRGWWGGGLGFPAVGQGPGGVSGQGCGVLWCRQWGTALS